MKKQLTGKVTSIKMQDTIIVEITRRIAHPLYKKLLTRSKKYKVAVHGQTVKVGDTVHITETRPVAKDKYFMLSEKKGKEQK